MAEQAVIVTIDFAGQDLDPIFELEERIESAIADSDCGEFDGNSVGQGKCELYMYGPDADALFAAVEPVLRASDLCRGALVLLRYGSAEDPKALERRVTL